MRLEFAEADVEWLKSFDFGYSSLGVRNTRLQSRVVRVPDLDWSVFTFLSPMGQGLWLLRVYRHLSDCLHDIFYAHLHGQEDEDRVRAFEKFLRKHRIPKKSEVAYNCFGLYPARWGDRFLPKFSSGLVHGRLLSVAVPSSQEEIFRRHFQAQMEQFGERCLAPANEDELLFNHSGSHNTPDGHVLLGFASRMTDDERAAVAGRLRDLIDNDDHRERFARDMPVGLKFSGASLQPDPRDILRGKEAACIEIARLRVKLLCRLRWPHALEYSLSSIKDTPQGDFADLVPEMESVLREFPCLSRDFFVKGGVHEHHRARFR